MDARDYVCNGYSDLTFRCVSREVVEKKCNQKYGHKKEILDVSNQIKVCPFQKLRCPRRVRVDNMPRTSIIREESEEEELCESNTDEEGSMQPETEPTPVPQHPTRKNKKWSIPILKLFRRSKSSSSESD